jgi:CheY-like chemotaxis protein
LHDELAARNQQLVESQQALVRREKMATVGLLAAGLAHEFNNIMNGISGYAQMARKNTNYLPTLVDVALTQGERARDVIDALRTFIRPQQQRFLPVRFSEVLGAVVCLVTKELERGSLELILRVPEDLPPVRAVPGQLQQILLNLVLNAVHATPPGGAIEVGADPAGEEIVIRVADTGSGIPPQDLDRIFDPFFTTKGSLGGGDVPGTGLGLTVVYNLVRAHGGTIAVESTEGRGAVFTVTIPQAREESSAPATGASRILLVTDDPAHEAQIREAAGNGDLRICRSCNEARPLIAGGAYATAVVDGDLATGEDPVAFLASIRAEDPGLFVVLLTANVEAGDLVGLADRHLLKPVDPELLRSLLTPQAAVA